MPESCGTEQNPCVVVPTENGFAHAQEAYAVGLMGIALVVLLLAVITVSSWGRRG